MKTLKTILIAVSFLLMLPFASQAQEDESFLINLTEYTIKFGQESNFTDGVKKWMKCYDEQKGTNKWRAWKRLQGKGNVFVVASFKENWAAMENSDESAKTCRPIAVESIIPHIESTEFNIARSMPAISKKDPLGDNTIVWVTSFDVNNGAVFNEIIKDVSTTIKGKEGGNRGYWYSFLGGEGANYFVSTPFKNFADLDTDKDGVWELYESVHGESKTKETREKFRASVDDIWSYTYMLQEELSKQ